MLCFPLGSVLCRNETQENLTFMPANVVLVHGAQADPWATSTHMILNFNVNESVSANERNGTGILIA
jgi:hypothetical protein